MANTSKTITTRAKEPKDYQKEIDQVARLMQEEKKVTISIPKGYEKSLGGEHFMGVNGAQVVIPVDGEDYDLPETLANHLKQFLKTVTL